MYTFKLQVVLDHRQFVEDNLKKELADIRQRCLAAKKHLDELSRKEMETEIDLKERQATGLSSDHVVGYQAYLQSLSERIRQQKKMVLALTQQEATKQDELREAMKERQILEKLKDRGLHRYQQEALKKEMNFIDEIAVNQFARRMIDTHGEGK